MHLLTGACSGWSAVGEYFRGGRLDLVERVERRKAKEEKEGDLDGRPEVVP